MGMHIDLMGRVSVTPALARSRGNGSGLRIPGPGGLHLRPCPRRVVAVSCAEAEEFWLIVPRDNEISEVLLSRGDCQEGFWPRLPGARPVDPLDPATYTDRVVRRRVEGVRYAVGERTT